MERGYAAQSTEAGLAVMHYFTCTNQLRAVERGLFSLPCWLSSPLQFYVFVFYPK